MRKLLSLLLVIFFVPDIGWTQEIVSRIDPPFWWTGMKDKHLQLLVYGKELGDVEVHLHHHHGVHLKDIARGESPDYLILNLEVAHHIHGEQQFEIEFKKGNMVEEITYLLHQRRDPGPLGLDQKDVIYRILPDRFVNGNPENDVVSGLLESGIDRSDNEARHGGDLAGIIQKLPYIKSLGVTTILIGSPFSNDLPGSSYLSNAVTDFYEVDPRLGSQEEMDQLAENIQNSGLKFGLDFNLNRFGKNHLFVARPPFNIWVEKSAPMLGDEIASTVFLDPYASTADKRNSTQIWDDSLSISLNVKDPFLMTYLNQHTIWWIERLGLNTIRVPDYATMDQFFLKYWGKAIRTEFPEIFIIAGVDNSSPAIQAYYMGHQGTHKNFENYVQSVQDYQLAYALNDLVSGQQDENSVYLTLSQDFLYQQPELLINFLDDAKMERWRRQCEGSFGKFRMGVVLQHMLRGIPMILYGTEIYLGSPDKLLYEDFPGGWSGDKENKFNTESLLGSERGAIDLVRKLTSFRKEHPQIFEGKMVQFVPQSGVYAFSRYSESEEILVMCNTSSDTTTVQIDLYKERFRGFVEYQEILTNTKNSFGKDVLLEPWGTRVFYFKRE